MLIVFLHTRRRLQPLWYVADELPGLGAGAVADEGWLPPLPWAAAWLRQGPSWQEDPLPSTPAGLAEDVWIPPLPWAVACGPPLWADTDTVFPLAPLALDDDGWLPSPRWGDRAPGSAWPPDEYPSLIPLVDDTAWQSPLVWGLWHGARAFLETETWVPPLLALAEEDWCPPVRWPARVWSQAWGDDEGYPTPAVPFFLDEVFWGAPVLWELWPLRLAWADDGAWPADMPLPAPRVALYAEVTVEPWIQVGPVTVEP